MNVYKDKAFLIALGISLVWHIMCVASITVVVAPQKKQPILFSKVSFLGPILERGVLSVGLQPSERTFLEKRYAAFIDTSARHLPPLVQGDALKKLPAYREESQDTTARVARYVEETINVPKVSPEPSFSE